MQVSENSAVYTPVNKNERKKFKTQFENYILTVKQYDIHSAKAKKHQELPSLKLTTMYERVYLILQLMHFRLRWLKL